MKPRDVSAMIIRLRKLDPPPAAATTACISPMLMAKHDIIPERIAHQPPAPGIFIREQMSRLRLPLCLRSRPPIRGIIPLLAPALPTKRPSGNAMVLRRRRQPHDVVVLVEGATGLVLGLAELFLVVVVVVEFVVGVGGEGGVGLGVNVEGGGLGDVGAGVGEGAVAAEVDGGVEGEGGGGEEKETAFKGYVSCGFIS